MCPRPRGQFLQELGGNIKLSKQALEAQVWGLTHHPPDSPWDPPSRHTPQNRAKILALVKTSVSVTVKS